MFPSRFFIYLIIPIVIIGLALWLFVTVDVDRSNVEVAGALVGASDVELTVNQSYFVQEESGRKLVVEMAARNICRQDVNLDPRRFQLVVASSKDPTNPARQTNIYMPMHTSSECDASPASLTHIPPDAVRLITLRFWAENVPEAEELEKYFLSLEYYDPSTPLMISKTINPCES